MTKLLSVLVLAMAVANAFAIDYEVIETKSSLFYNSYVVKYVSVSADMAATDTVSGVITIPTNRQANCIILDNHHTITSNSEAPSVQGSTTAGMLLGLGYVIAATDYIGYGMTSSKTHPYLNQRQNAQNAIDIAKVAWDLVRKDDVKLKYEKLLNIGYSQGGGVAMAVHRAMEEQPELAEELNFAGSWCGDGPYDIKATVQDYLSHPDNVTYPLGLPMLVNGFLSGAPAEMKGDLKFSDFITDQMVNAGLETWLSEKKMDNDEINDMMKAVVGDRPLTVADIFKPEAASEDGVLMQKYFEFAEANSMCKGWQPTYPIKLVHLICDQVVPVLNAYNAIEGLQLTSDQYLLDDAESVHADYGLTFYMKFINDLNTFDFGGATSIAATPADNAATRPAKLLEGGRIVILRNGMKYDPTGRAIN